MKTNFTEIITLFFPKITDYQIVSYGNGHINSTFLVTWKVDGIAQKYILQAINTKIFQQPEKIANNIKLVADFLSNQAYRYKVLQPILTAEGKTFVVKEEKYWRVFPYFSNSYAPETCNNFAQAYDAGIAYGHFFKTLSTLEVEKLETIIPDFHNATLRWEQFEKSLKNAKTKRLEEAKELIDFCKKNQHYIEKYKEIIPKIPIRTTHNDTKITNILFDKNTHKPLAIIDLDTIQPGTILSEFGDMVRTFCNSGNEDEPNESKISFQENFFDALKKGFLSECGDFLEKIEIDSMVFGAKLTIFVQAMRFLTDYLNNDIYYKISFPKHNFYRAKNQITLLKKIK
jgi:hypothetical protein